MKMTNQCLVCCTRGSLDAARLATDDPEKQEAVLRETLAHLAGLDLETPPPLMARFIHKTVERITGVADPFKQLKDTYNDFALSLYPGLLRRVEEGNFETAVRLAIAGNIIDFGAHNSVGKTRVMDTIDHALETSVTGDVKALESACRKAQNILWLADNTGEIVFDKLLLSCLDTDRVTYAVRGGPAQNDATLEDAEYTGVTDMVRVIDTGDAIPGVILSRCSDVFKQAYAAADLIIAKGQGNFETLDLTDPRIFFLFKAKCPVVADQAGVKLHDIVIKRVAR